jgi:hypothetical protein
MPGVVNRAHPAGACALALYPMTTPRPLRSALAANGPVASPRLLLPESRDGRNCRRPRSELGNAAFAPLLPPVPPSCALRYSAAVRRGQLSN